jgi:hypothetical protein
LTLSIVYEESTSRLWVIPVRPFTKICIAIAQVRYLTAAKKHQARS